jgi:hypothetical protein
VLRAKRDEVVDGCDGVGVALDVCAKKLTACWMVRGHVVSKRNGVTLGEANGIKAVLEFVEGGDLVSDERDLVVHVAKLENTVY